MATLFLSPSVNINFHFSIDIFHIPIQAYYLPKLIRLSLEKDEIIRYRAYKGWIILLGNKNLFFTFAVCLERVRCI